MYGTSVHMYFVSLTFTGPLWCKLTVVHELCMACVCMCILIHSPLQGLYGTSGPGIWPGPVTVGYNSCLCPCSTPGYSTCNNSPSYVYRYMYIYFNYINLCIERIKHITSCINPRHQFQASQLLRNISRN